MMRFFSYKMLKHPGVFELFGVDYLFDTNLNLWVLEINRSPAIQGTSDDKRNLLLKMMHGIFDIEFALMVGADLD